jgi:hypothetical protein
MLTGLAFFSSSQEAQERETPHPRPAQTGTLHGQYLKFFSGQMLEIFSNNCAVATLLTD